MAVREVQVRRIDLNLETGEFRVWFKGVDGSFTRDDYDRESNTDYAYTLTAARLLPDNVNNYHWAPPVSGKPGRPDGGLGDEPEGMDEANITAFFRELRKP